MPEVDNRFDIALFKECIKKSQWLIATAENHFSTKRGGRTCRFGGTTKIAIINRQAFNTGSYILGAAFFCFLLKRYMSFLKYCVEIEAVTTVKKENKNTITGSSSLSAVGAGSSVPKRLVSCTNGSCNFFFRHYDIS